MKRLFVLIVATLVCTAAVAGGHRGNSHGGNRHGGHYNSGGHYNGWAVAGAFAAGAVVGSWSQPQFVAPFPVVPHPMFVPQWGWGVQYAPQPVVICVQSGDSPYFQQGNCFTRYMR